MDSSEIGATPVRPPGWPSPRPNGLLKYDPSMVMLFCRLSWPAKEVPLAWGVSRVMSLTLPEMVGSNPISTRATDVAAPVRLELKTGSICPVTVTVSCTAIGRTMNARSVAMPRLTWTSSCVSGAKAVPPPPPLNVIVTEYGPPTRMPGMENRPSPRVVASYTDPEGTWMAITLAPAIGCC